jgi:dTDP-4-dehydrorhamnose reductase
MRVVVTGASGQLGTALCAALRGAGLEPVPASRPGLDITARDRVAAAIAAAGAGLVVNCAAFTGVDAAEEQEAAAFAANALGAAIIAQETAAAGIPLLQISTDYVFDGGLGRPLREDDAAAPLGAYGRSKLAGEWAVLAGNPRSMVLRTAWLFGPAGRNFVRTMLALGGQRPELRVVADQYGNPTSALELAAAITRIAERIARAGWDAGYAGVFHAAAPDHASWFDLAEAVFAGAARRGAAVPRVQPIGTAEYPTRARRPADSRLDVTRLQETFGIRLAPWREQLDRAMGAMDVPVGDRSRRA